MGDESISFSSSRQKSSMDGREETWMSRLSSKQNLQRLKELERKSNVCQKSDACTLLFCCKDEVTWDFDPLGGSGSIMLSRSCSEQPFLR